jgi:hypothetical protein
MQQNMTPNNNQAANSSSNNNYLYGNRNLSPLFKAAAGRETPPRPSSLRQELGSPSVGYQNGHSHYGGNYQHGGISQNGMQFQNGFNSQHGNGNNIAREYLDQQIRQSAPAEMPGFGVRAQGQHTQQQSVGGGGYGQQQQQGGGGSGGQQNLKVMEDDLRRMLKLG